MADPIHVKVLMEGVDAWNQWRKRYPDVAPDLSGMEFRGRNFSTADFRRTDLSSVNLRRANVQNATFQDASLAHANLSKSNLRTADFGRASLAWSDIRNADVTDACLIEADLTRSDLIRADMRGADLTRATLAETVFGATLLGKVVGLETCLFVGPCVLDFQTVSQSWPVPVQFLRGCGWPDWQIEVAKLSQRGISNGEITDILARVHRVHATRPAQYCSVFISYSAKDETFARKLRDDLQRDGVRCWFAPEDLYMAEEIEPKIDRAIQTRDKVLIILSKNSLESGWVEREVKRGIAEEEARGEPVLFPIRIDEAVMDCPERWATMIRRKRNIGDFTDWRDDASYQREFDRMLQALIRAPEE